MGESDNSSFWGQTRGLTWPFWVANLMETIERLAYYGVRVVIPIYIAQADEIGGLHFSQSDKGFIFLWWAIVQSTLPVLSGGFADRYGLQKSDRGGHRHQNPGLPDDGYPTDFLAVLRRLPAAGRGTAVFKPPVWGTFAKTLTTKTSGVGWGFFYMIINIGAFLGPPLAHSDGYSWPMVFYGCALLVNLNLLWLFTYREVNPGSAETTGVFQVVADTARGILNLRLLTFIVIISVFWAVLEQLWDTLPNFIVDRVDSYALARHLPAFMLSRNLSRGPQLAQERVINLNPLLIILVVAPLSWYANRGDAPAHLHFFRLYPGDSGRLCGRFQHVHFHLPGRHHLFHHWRDALFPQDAGILAVIAPPDKKAQYMGYASIPYAFGWGYGSFLAGQLYERSGEKAGLALRYLSQVLQVHDLPDRSRAFAALTERLGQTPAQVTRLLWDQYDPSRGLDALRHRRHLSRHRHVCLPPLCQALAGCQRLTDWS